MKKQRLELSKDEFRAVLSRHVNEDVEKAFPGSEQTISMMLDEKDFYFVTQLRKK